MIRGVKRSHIGNVNNLSSDYNEPKENPILVGNGPSAFESMSKAMAETEKKDFIQAIIPAFVAPSSQNVIERIENKDYISPNNNTDVRERVRFEIQFNKPYSLKDGFLRLYLKLVSVLGMPIDVTTLEKAGRTVLVNMFKETLIKEIKIYKDGSSDVINNNTEHTPWKNYIFKHRLRPKSRKNYLLQELDIQYPEVSIGSTARRIAANSAANIVVQEAFTKRAAYTTRLSNTVDDGLIVDIPLADLDMIFQSKLPFNPSTNLSLEFYFETNNKKLLEINANIPVAAATTSELLKITFKKTPELHIPQFHLSSTYSEALNTGYSLFKHASIVNEMDAKLLQHNISMGVTNYSTSLDVPNQPTFLAFGLITEKNFQHLTHFDNAYCLEPLTNFKTLKVSHIIDGSILSDLEYNFNKKDDLEKLYRQYRAFVTNTPSITPLSLLYHQFNNIELPTYTEYFRNHTSASPIVLDISVDKGTTGATSLPWAGANTKVDIQFDAATTSEMKLLIWCIYDANVEMSKRAHNYNIQYNPRTMMMVS